MGVSKSAAHLLQGHSIASSTMAPTFDFSFDRLCSSARYALQSALAGSRAVVSAASTFYFLGLAMLIMFRRLTTDLRGLRACRYEIEQKRCTVRWARACCSTL